MQLKPAINEIYDNFLVFNALNLKIFNKKIKKLKNVNKIIRIRDNFQKYAYYFHLLY